MDIEKLIEKLHDASQSQIGMWAEDNSAVIEKSAAALSTLQAENEKLRAELERMKEIMRYNGIMVIPSKYPGGRSEWNIPKPRG